MLRLDDDRVVAIGAAQRRQVARCISRIGRDHRLLAFGAADNHVHIETLGDDANARRCAWRVELALSHGLRLDVPFRKRRIKPILSQGHLGSTFFYALRQERHHGVLPDPLCDASNLPDLLGMRVVGAYTCNAQRNYLPRVTRAELIELLEVEPRTAGFALEDLADAAAGAWALANLHGRRADAVAARHAAAHAAVSFSHPAAIAETLGISRRRVDQLLRAECRPAEVTAVQRQLGLRAALREAEAVARDGLVRLPARSQRPGGAAALRER